LGEGDRDQTTNASAVALESVATGV
jgi:hypothetical protein